MAASGPDFAALQVRDLAASAPFSETRLGLAPDGPPDAIVFATQPIPFAVRKPLVDLDAVDPDGYRVVMHDG